jgi:hypothetical protein
LSNNGLYIQYGCGLCAPADWLNFDASPRLRIERSILLRPIVRSTVGFLFPANVTVGDIVSGLPVPAESAAGIYCSHVLEHLPRDDLPRALANTFRILSAAEDFVLWSRICIGEWCDIWQVQSGMTRALQTSYSVRPCWEKEGSRAIWLASLKITMAIVLIFGCTISLP